jgi:hypothetical protein
MHHAYATDSCGFIKKIAFSGQNFPQPPIVKKHKERKITARCIASDIFNLNGWNIPEDRKQLNLFNF